MIIVTKNLMCFVKKYKLSKRALADILVMDINVLDKNLKEKTFEIGEYRSSRLLQAFGLMDVLSMLSVATFQREVMN